MPSPPVLLLATDTGGSPYFVLLSIGFALAFLFATRIGDRRGLPRLAVIDACIAALVGGIVGARILHVAVEPLPGDALAADRRAEVARLGDELEPRLRDAVRRGLARPDAPVAWEFIVRMPPGAAQDEAIARVEQDPSGVPARLWYRARPLEAVAFWKGGLAYLGGLIVASALALWATHRHRVPLGAMADLAAPAIMLGATFGRLGCFIGGCCYGQVCEDRWWSVRWPADLGPLPRYPTALLEAGWDLLLFVLLTAWLLRTPRPGEGAVRHGRVFLGMLVLYAPGRFAIEALRADPRGGAVGLSTSQLLALLMGVPALVLLVLDRVWPPRAAAGPAAPTAPPP